MLRTVSTAWLVIRAGTCIAVLVAVPAGGEVIGARDTASHAARDPSTSSVQRAALARRVSALPIGVFVPGPASEAPTFSARFGGVRVVVAPDRLAFAGIDGEGRVTMKLVGADGHAAIAGEQPQPTRVNYFLGNDPTRWRSNVPTFTAVRSCGVYPGIDVVVRAEGDAVRYDFEVAPGADPSRIRFTFEGANDVAVTSEGDLRVGVGSTFVVHRRPRLFQLVEGTRRPIEGSFHLVGGHTVGFAIRDYARGHALVIDPTLEFGTYYGGSGNETIDGAAVEPSGAVLVFGTTTSLALPGAGVSAGGRDAFIARFDPQGTMLLSATFLGGTGDETVGLFGLSGQALAVDAAGAVYVTGSTTSADFPTTPGAVQPVPLGERIGFVVKLAPGGSSISYSTYLGGAVPMAIAVDSAGQAYVVGFAVTDFVEVTPVAEANAGVGHAFLARLSANGADLTFSTRFGGGDEPAWTVAADDQGNAYVAGGTLSAQFPTKSAVQAVYAGDDCGHFFAFGDGFVTKFNTVQPGLVYSTYLGGTSADSVLGLAVDMLGAAYVTGWTNSTDLPTTNALQPVPGSAPSDAFVAKISPSGSELIYSTYLGGNGTCGGGPGGCCIGGEGGNAIAVAAGGTAWVAGFTNGSDFPLAEPLQSGLNGSQDAFVAAIAPDGSRLVFSTYLGGSGGDMARGIAVAPDGDVVVVGATDSTDFPTPNGAFPSYAGGGDGFVVRIAAQTTALTVAPSASPTSGLAPLAVSFTATPSGGTGIYAFDWDFGDSSPHSTLQNPIHTYAAGGNYTARVAVTDSAAATATATVTIEVQATCALSCTASAPLAASVLATSPLAPVAFTASASVSPDCPSSPSFAWTFGDGQTSTEEDPSHVYPAAGAYGWTMTASVAGRTCTRHGIVVVTALSHVDTLRIIPAVAHNDGFLGSKWRTDLALVNASSQPAGLSLVFFGADGPIVRTAALAGGASREWHDLLVSLFGLTDDAVARGTVQVAADAPVALAARTYNLALSGTYGQTFPALALGEGVASGQGGLIAGLKKTPAFRTNLGVVNTSTQESTVRIALADAAGAALGSPLTVTVPAGRWIQIDDVFAASGAPETELASASIEVLTPATSAWAYAAVIDNATGDPTTVPVTVP